LTRAAPYGRDVRVDFLRHRESLCGQVHAASHVSPTTPGG